MLGGIGILIRLRFIFGISSVMCFITKQVKFLRKPLHLDLIVTRAHEVIRLPVLPIPVIFALTDVCLMPSL